MRFSLPSTRLAEKQLNESDRDIHDKADLAALRRRIKDLEREIAAITAPKVFSKKDYSKMAMRCGDVSIDGGLTLADLRKDDPKHCKDIKDWMERHTRNTELTLPAYLAKFAPSRLPGEMLGFTPPVSSVVAWTAILCRSMPDESEAHRDYQFPFRVHVFPATPAGITLSVAVETT